MFKLSGNKRTEMVRGRNLKDPELFPVSLILPNLNLKLEITYDMTIDKFNLMMNGSPFLDCNRYVEDAATENSGYTTLEAANQAMNKISAEVFKINEIQILEQN